MPREQPDSGRSYAIVGLVTLALIIVACAIVWPFGEYAVDDEWAYVRSLERLQYEGRLEISAWNPMSLIGHLVWGWLFTSVFGVSFTVTKLSVVVAFIVECAVCLALLRHFEVPARIAMFAMATLVFDPLHFFHAFQFTTDITTIMWAFIALLLYIRVLDGVTQWPTTMLLLASTCAGMAFLARQSGAMIALAVLASLVVSDRRQLARPGFWAAAFGPVLVAVVVFTWWYQNVHGATLAYQELQGAMWRSLVEPSPAVFGRTLFVVAIYVGLFAMPLTFGALPLLRRPSIRQRVALAIAGGAGVAVILGLGLAAGDVFPYLRNKLTPFGYMRPNEFILGNRPVLWPDGTEWVLALLSLLSALAILAAGSSAMELFRGPRRRGSWLLLTFFLGQVAYGVLTHKILFDRHLLMLAPTAIVLYAALVGTFAVVRPIVFSALLAPLAFASVAGTHDIHAIARTAFRAGEAALASGVPPNRLDAGYAFDGWHVFHVQRLGDPAWAVPEDAWWVRHLMPTIRTDYVVSLTPTLVYNAAMERLAGSDRQLFVSPSLQNHQVIRSYPYRTLWPWADRELYLVARE